MLNKFLIFSPCIVSVLLSIYMLFKKDKNAALIAFSWLVFICAGYFFVDGNYVIYHEDYTPLVYLDVIGQFLTLCLPSFMLIYLQKESGAHSDMLFVYLLFIFPLLMLVTDITIYSYMGVDRAAEHIMAYDAAKGDPVGFDDTIFKVHRFVCMSLYNCLLLVLLLIVAAYIAVLLIRNNARPKDMYPFFFRGRRTASINVICSLMIAILLISCVRICLGRIWLLSHSGWSAALSLLLAISILSLGYVAVFFNRCVVSFKDLLSPSHRDEYRIDALGYDELLTKMDNYLLETKAYHSSDICLENVASAINCERFQLSTAMVQCYSMSFNDYIRHLRVNEARRILVENPESALETIATTCGFSSTTEFHDEFLKIVGIPPRLYHNSYISGSHK